jgi:cyclophilin family peptidyl-prolyl cis-trans isomerase
MTSSVFASSWSRNTLITCAGWMCAFWFAFGLPQSVPGVPSEDGLYATFQVSRNGELLGEFTARLEFEKAPQTVANFVGLAEGSRSWIDFQKGLRSQKPFYNGITFHRVVAGFVIQAGSPNGAGTDGPGYTFRDEFHPQLRHDKAGILSMANSGLNSNGSQFFVTLDATPHLNGVHSVFGEVIEGMSAVMSVQQGDVIQAVIITRNGMAAEAFDADAQGLPAALGVGTQLLKSEGGFQLNYPLSSNSETFVFHSDDLDTWSELPGRELHAAAPTSSSRDVSAMTNGKAKQFFAAAKVQYPDAIQTPASVTGTVLTLTDQGGFALAFSMSDSSAGSYTFTDSQTHGPFSINFYQWLQEAYRGRFFANIAGALSYEGFPIVQANISFVFSSPAGGVYRGSLINQIGRQFSIAGTFSAAEI